MSTFQTHTPQRGAIFARRGFNPTTGLRRLLRPARIAVALLGAGGLLWIIAEWTRLVGASAALSESGAIELTQVALLGTALLLLLRRSHGRPAAALFVLVGLLLLTMLVRELDSTFDKVFHGAWKVPAYAIVLWAGLLFLQRKDEVSYQWHRLKGTRGVGVFIAGLFVVLIQSRLLGQQSVWQGALQEDYIRHAPRLMEELCELGGYAIVLVSAIDLRSSLNAGVLDDPRDAGHEAHQERGQPSLAADESVGAEVRSTRIYSSNT